MFWMGIHHLWKLDEDRRTATARPAYKKRPRSEVALYIWTRLRWPCPDFQTLVTIF